MAFTTSPNMFLRIPVVGNEPGPDYAIDVNYDLLSVLDTHDHTSGRGVQITPAGLNINQNLTFNNNFAVDLAGLTLIAQSSTPTLSTVYQSGVDLYYVDGIGNNIRITQAGGVAGAPGSITGLTPPASVTYIPGSQTFVFQSGVGIAANIDVGSIFIRDLSPNSTFAVELDPPPNLAFNYSLQLPLIPAQESFLSLDTSGIIQSHWTVDNSTIKILSNQLVVQGANVPNSSREHNWELNGNYGALGASSLLSVDAIFIAPYNLVINSMWIYNGTPGTGQTQFDLKVKSPGGSYTTILSQPGTITSAAAADIYTDSGSVIGAQTGVTKPIIAVNAITAGQAIRFDMTGVMGGAAADCRCRIYWTQA